MGSFLIGKLNPKQREREPKVKIVTRADIKAIKKALKIADRANDYEVVEWSLGEIEAIANKIESRLDKAGKQ